MVDQVDRLRIEMEVAGTGTLADGSKTSAAEVHKLGEELDRTGRGLDSAGAKAETAGRRVGALGRELAQGDWRNAALEAGRLAAGTEAAGAGFGLLGAAVGVTAVALGTYAAAVYMARAETERQANALLLTGNYAGLVAGQLNELARSSAAAINGNLSSTQTTLEALVGTGRVTSQSLEAMGRAVELVMHASGKNRDAVLGDFAGMADGVAKWAAEHNKAYHFLTFEQYKYIESLEKAGHEQEAMRVTSVALSQHLGGDMTRNLGTIDQMLKWGRDSWSRWWDAAMNLGREDTVGDRITQLQKNLEALETRKTTGRLTTDQREGLMATLREQIAAAKEVERLERMSADRRSMNAQREEARIEADREKKKTVREDPEIEARRALVAELAGLSGSFAKDWDRLSVLFKQGALSVDQLTKAQADLLAKQPFMRALAKEQADAARDDAALQTAIARARQQAADATTKDWEAKEREIAGLVRGNEALEDGIAAIGKTKGEIQQLKAARLEHAIALARESLLISDNADRYNPQREQIQRTIQELERQRNLTQQLGAKQDADDLRKKNEAEGKKFSDDLRRDVTDSLQRGFEAGKSPARNLADTVGNVIKTRVTRALAEAFADPILRPLEMALGRGGGGGGGGLPGFDLFSDTGLFGGGTPDFDLSWFFAPFKHTGGIAGGDGGSRQRVNPAVFAGAPRFHGGGIVGDEVPIIAKKTEGVFTEGQMKALAPVGSAAPQITVNVHTLPGQTATVQQRRGSEGTSIDVIVRQLEEQLADGVASGSGVLGQAIEGRYNLRTAVS